MMSEMKKRINKILTYSISVVVISTLLFAINPISTQAAECLHDGDDFIATVGPSFGSVGANHNVGEENIYTNCNIKITVDQTGLYSGQPGFDVFLQIDKSQFGMNNKKIQIYKKGYPHRRETFVYKIPKGQKLEYKGWTNDTSGQDSYMTGTFKLVEYDPSLDDEVDDYETIDHDTYKSCLPSATITAGDMAYGNFFDLKAHEMNSTTAKNQEMLANLDPNAKGKKARIISKYDIYPRRDLSITEKGSLTTLTWNSLPVNTAGPIYAVCYSQNSGPYYLVGMVDSKGTAKFPNFRLNEATSISVYQLNIH